MAGLLAGTLVPGPWAPWPWPYRTSEVWFGLGSAAVLLAGAWVGHLPRLARRWLSRPGLEWLSPASRRGPVLATSVALACAAIVAGAFVNRRYERQRYGNDALYSWVSRHLHGARIAIAGFDRQYPLWGSTWANYIQYVGTIQPHGGFTVSQSCRAWGSALDAGRFGYVALRGDLLFSYPHGFPEFRWTLLSDRTARAVFAGSGAIVVKLVRPPDPGRCPPGPV
jgi:hypothetical protein